jgi:hypothetical protein
MKRFLNNIELWFSGAGLLVVWIAAVIVAPGNANVWQIAAVTALVVSVLHGMIFWVVRGRQRRLRARSINEIREMLADVVKNDLAVIQMVLPEEKSFEVEMIKERIEAIGAQVDHLSEEALTTWKQHYREAVVNATDLQPA